MINEPVHEFFRFHMLLKQLLSFNPSLLNQRFSFFITESANSFTSALSKLSPKFCKDALLFEKTLTFHQRRLSLANPLADKIEVDVSPVRIGFRP